eukprot:3454445-Prymnesium_polylepis.2
MKNTPSLGMLPAPSHNSRHHATCAHTSQSIGYSVRLCHTAERLSGLIVPASAAPGVRRFTT